MAQSATIEANGVLPPSDEVEQNRTLFPGKRKRDSSDDGVEMNGVDEKEVDTAKSMPALKRNQKELVKSYFAVLQSFDVADSILKRNLPDAENHDEPRTKRQKSAEPTAVSSIADKVANEAYNHLDEIASDLLIAVKESLAEYDSDSSSNKNEADSTPTRTQIHEFRDRAMEILHREQLYPSRPDSGYESKNENPKQDETQDGAVVLTLVGYAPQERRLFSSLPLKESTDLQDAKLPVGVSLSRVIPSSPKAEKVSTLGELFGSPRAPVPLQAPKPPRNQAKGNQLDFYHPELTDRAQYQSSNYFTTRLSAGHYLDYSQAASVGQLKDKHHERAASLAGKKPSPDEIEASEMEALFRGAFSSFAPCKDDSAALVPSSAAGRIWWQRAGRYNFERRVELDYYNNEKEDKAPVEIDDAAVRDAIDTWDEVAIDPSLDDIMGSKRAEEKEADEILDEVSDLIETLASYQRIRNLNLPNSQNRQTSEPVNGDMLTSAGPKPSPEEVGTYEVLKAQLALIVKTLPPYAVAKLNGDQLDELLISTKVQVSSDQFRGTMEEDESGVQARIRAQQAAAQATPRPAQRQPSMSTPYTNHYQPQNQYATPNRTPSHPQQFYRPGPNPNFTPRPFPQAQRTPQPNQYSRQNGYPNQYATQVAKAQTPYGHQNMAQFPNQPRNQYNQMAPQGAGQARYPYQQGGFPPQQGTPQQGTPQQSTPQQGYNQYTNGAGVPPRQMSPQVNRQAYSPSPNTPHHQPQRYSTPNQMQSQMQSQMSRFQAQPQPHPQGRPQAHTPTPGQGPGLTGYHTVISEAQQQRILEQAKARVAAQERSASFGDKMSQPGTPVGMNHQNRSASMGGQQIQQQHQQPPRTGTPGSNGTPHVPPQRVTPVPLPQMPGQSQPQQQQQR